MTRTDDVRTNEGTVEPCARDDDLPVPAVRHDQTRDLVPPPRREGRIAFYARRHRRRLRLIAPRHERGFSLAPIKERVVGMDAGQSLHAVLGLGRTTGPWLGEEPARLGLAELLPADRIPEVTRALAQLAPLAEAGDTVVRCHSHQDAADAFLGAAEHLDVDLPAWTRPPTTRRS